jgi:hypothetical protein
LPAFRDSAGNTWSTEPPRVSIWTTKGVPRSTRFMYGAVPKATPVDRPLEGRNQKRPKPASRLTVNRMDGPEPTFWMLATSSRL